MASTVSVVVPYYDPDATSAWMLQELVESLLVQTTLPHEIVISSVHDVSNLTELARLVNEKFPIRTVKSSAKNAPENINFAVSQSSGEIVKLLFHDDLLAHAEALSNSVKALENTGFKWVVSASQNFNSDKELKYVPNLPKFPLLMALGENRLGAPSAATFYRLHYVPMNGDFAFLYDCDWYLSMREANGSPALLTTNDVGIRIHGGQATNSVKSLRWSEAGKVLLRHPWSIFGR
jgi:glycosyltransferase involved in cell wall biosynthesis